MFVCLHDGWTDLVWGRLEPGLPSLKTKARNSTCKLLRQVCKKKKVYWKQADWQGLLGSEAQLQNE